MSKETMKLAIELLKSAHVSTDLVWKRHDCVQALEEALKQEQKRPQNCGTSYCSCIECVMEQEQGEPVVWFREEDEEKIYYATKAWDDCLPLYTTPQQRKPLTDEMIVAGGKALAKLHADTCGLDFDDVWKYYAEDHKADAKAVIEAVHGNKE